MAQHLFANLGCNILRYNHNEDILVMVKSNSQKEITMIKDPKTTITAFVAGVVALASHFNVVIPDDYQAAIIAVGLIVLGWFAKDGSA